MIKINLNPETAYLFDVDGVLSDLNQKKVTQEEIFNQLILRLEKGEPIGLNTGRGLDWLIERIINPLVLRTKDKKILQNFIAVGENGGVWLTFDLDGKTYQQSENSLEASQELRGKVISLVERKYSESVAVYENKKIIISTEMKDGYDLDEFKKRQKDLVRDLEDLVKESEETRLTVGSSTIGNDIADEKLGKDFGAQRFMMFLKDRGIVPDIIETFGDSKSDMAMADELKRKGKNVKLVYVGKEEDVVDVDKEYEIEYVEGYSQGTLEYLQRAA